MSRGSRRRQRDADWRVVHQVASHSLSYPDEELRSRLPLLGRALQEQPSSPPVEHLQAFLAHAGSRSPRELVDEYVALFDLSRKHTLYLSYWTDGDTRRRGGTLADFKQRYRDSGFLVDTHGELPDHLPLVLEYAALADPAGGRALLQDYRASLELIRLSLIDQHTPYAEVLGAVCATLPGASPTDRAGAMALAGAAATPAPPVEDVGIEFLGRPGVGPPLVGSEGAG